MRLPGWITAVLGLAAGGALVVLLPEETIFHAPQTRDAAAEATGERWACAMMDFIGTKPGDCPVCGMTLQKVTAGELTREQRRRMGIELTTISEGPATAVIRAYGAVRYDDRTARAVVARVAGRIVSRHAGTLHAGTIVAPGDPLIELYSPEVFAAQGELAAALKLGNTAAANALTERFRRWNLEAVAQAIFAGND
ncbi:MAG: efflux RND transporter periplasmic adaptor subunit, partial [Opitutaceae bacterium]|nr:efflux RND transporter periplasmic adaptor subunit [Opitutaceae bacterium]